MNKRQEKLLIVGLCGIVIAAATAFAIQPATAAGYGVDQMARVSNVARWDQLNVRKWPASYSQKIGAFKPGAQVWVERCIEKDGGADWCIVDGNYTRGWVNARYLTPGADWDI